MVQIGSVRCETIRHDLVAQTFALIAIVGSFCTEFRAVEKQSQMHPNWKKRTKMWVQGRMVWIGNVRYEKFRLDFVPRNFALITKFWRVLHRVSRNSETVPNSPKRRETHQNMSLGSNFVDWEHWLWKLSTWLRTTNFCINCTILTHFAPSFVQ